MADDPGTSAPAPTSIADVLQGALPGIIGRAKVVVSPYPFATNDNDQLRITVVNSLPGVVVNVHGRAVTRAGDAIPFNFIMTPSSDRMPTTKDFPLAGGFVSNLSAFASGAAPFIGQTFVIVQIISGAGIAAYALGTLLSSYVTTTQPIGWPGTPIESSIEGGGYTRFVQGTDPAPGADVSETVPVGARWEVLTIGAQINTSAAGGTRRARFALRSGGVSLIDNFNPGTVGPSSTFAFAFAQGMTLQSAFATQSSYGGLPTGVQMSAGTVFGLSLDAMDVADNWGPPAYYVREWLEAS